jgi:hypothetical protein
MRTRTPIAAVLPLLVLLVGCTAPVAVEPPDQPETYASDPSNADTTTEVVPPGEVETDTTLIVKTLVTAGNGAQLALEMRVRQPIAFDDVANQTLPGAFVESCGSSYNADLFAAESWSFTRANVSAVATSASGAEWPSGVAIDVVPAASSVPVIGRGMLRESSTSTSPCTDAKSFDGQGNGAIALGVAGDTGAFVGWANQRFGFGAAVGVTFSECTIELTTLGEQFSGGSSWVTASDPKSCTVGAAG